MVYCHWRIDRFMDSAGFVSEEEMQLIWGKILAEEFQNPGSTPTSLTRILSEITPHLARTFKIICSMKVIIIPLKDDGDIELNAANYSIFVPYIKQDRTFANLGIYFKDIGELESLGLIKFNSISGFVQRDINRALIYSKNNLTMIEDLKNAELPIGNVMLTSVGEALSRITESEDIDGFNHMVDKYLEDQRCKIVYEHDYDSVIIDDTIEFVKK